MVSLAATLGGGLACGSDTHSRAVCPRLVWRGWCVVWCVVCAVPSAQSIDPRIRVIGAEPAACDDAARSLAAGSVQGNDAPFVTVADGLRTTLGDNTWPVVRDMVDAIVVVSEEEIVAGMKLIWQRMKLVRCVHSEASGAVRCGAGTVQCVHAACL